MNKVSGLLKLLRPTSVERRHEPSKHLRSELIYNLRMFVPIEAVVPTGSDSCIGEGQFHDQLEVVARCVPGWSRFGLGSVCQAIDRSLLISYFDLISVECYRIYNK